MVICLHLTLRNPFMPFRRSALTAALFILTNVAPAAAQSVPLPEAQIGPLFSRVRVVKRALESTLGADGAFIAVNDRVSQSVAHLHVHVVPRWRNDKLFSTALVWKRQPYRSAEEMAACFWAIR